LGKKWKTKNIGMWQEKYFNSFEKRIINIFEKKLRKVISKFIQRILLKNLIDNGIIDSNGYNHFKFSDTWMKTIKREYNIAKYFLFISLLLFLIFLLFLH